MPSFSELSGKQAASDSVTALDRPGLYRSLLLIAKGYNSNA